MDHLVDHFSQCSSVLLVTRSANVGSVPFLLAFGRSQSHSRGQLYSRPIASIVRARTAVAPHTKLS
jgi:hypothetical protein